MKKISLFFFFVLSSLFVVHAQNAEIDSLENLLQKHTEKDTARVDLLIKIADKLYRFDIHKTLKFAVKADSLSDVLTYKKGKAESLRLIGNYYKMKSDYPKAFDYNQKALKISEEIEDKKGIADCYTNMGYIYKEQGKYSMALEYYQKSLKISEEINDKSGIAECLNYFGVISYEMRSFADALKYYQKSLKIYNELNFKSGISNELNNIALIYEKQNKLEKALYYYNKSITIGEEINYTHLLGWAYNGNGIVLMKQQKYKEALEFLLKGLEKRESINERKEISQSCNCIGKLYMKIKKYRIAKEYFLRGYNIANDIENPLNLKDAAEGLAIVYEHTGQHKKALYYHKLFNQVSDSLRDEDNLKMLTGFEIRNQYEKEKHALELEQQKKDLIKAETEKRQKIIGISFIAGFAIMFLLALLIFLGFMRKSKTNKILAEEKSESEEKYRTLMENMNDIVMLVDNDDKILFVNKRFSEKLGYSESEIIGEIGYKKLLSPKDQEIIFKANQDRKRNIKSQYEITFIAKDGKNFDFLVSGAPVKDSDGNIIGSIGNMIDITERKQTELALKESQQLFQTLAQSSPVGIFRTKSDGYTTYVNPKWVELTGLSFEDAIGDGWLKAVHPEDKEVLQKNWELYSRKGKSVIEEYRFVKPNGSIVWVFGNAVPEFIDNEINGYIGTITDITERKITEKELEKYRTNLELLVKDRTKELENANHELEKLSIVASETDNGVIIADHTGKIEWINEGYTRMFGYNLQEFIQNNGDTLINSSHNEDIDFYFNKCITIKKSVLYSSLNKTKSGKEIWVQTTLTPVLDSDGKINKIVAIDSDISILKR